MDYEAAFYEIKNLLGMNFGYNLDIISFILLKYCK